MSLTLANSDQTFHEHLDRQSRHLTWHNQIVKVPHNDTLNGGTTAWHQTHDKGILSLSPDQGVAMQ